MRDKLLKRKLNPFLLITTVMVLAILAGLSVMYQQELGELVGTKDNLSTELKDTEAELEQARKNITRLRDTRGSLNSEIENLTTTLENVRESKNSEISGLEGDLEEARSERDNWKQKFEDKNETAATLEKENSDLSNALTFVCGDLNESESSYDYCEQHGFD